jgi:hypothetical protein
MSLAVLSVEDEIERLLAREREERAAAAAATDPESRDRHFMAAERYADQVWSLEEAHDLPYRASGLWAA